MIVQLGERVGAWRTFGSVLVLCSAELLSKHKARRCFLLTRNKNTSIRLHRTAYPGITALYTNQRPLASCSSIRRRPVDVSGSTQEDGQRDLDDPQPSLQSCRCSLWEDDWSLSVDLLLLHSLLLSWERQLFMCQLSVLPSVKLGVSSYHTGGRLFWN